MAKTLTKEIDSDNPSTKLPLPQATPGDHWVAAWKKAAAYDENGRRLQSAALTVLFNTKEHFSPAGLGTCRLRRADVPVNDDGSAFIASLGTCTRIGSASFIGGRAWLKALLDGTPDIGEVDGVLALTTAMHSLDSLESLPRRNLASFDHRVGHEYALILTDDYGVAYVPKMAAAGLVRVEGDAHPALVHTHVLCNVLGTKHGLLGQLGMDDAVALDKRLIGNALERAR